MNNLKLMKNEKEYTILGVKYRSSSICAIGYTNPEKIRKQRIEHVKIPHKGETFSKYITNIYGACNDNQVECILYIGELKPWIINIFNNISHMNSKSQQWDRTQRKMVAYDDGRTQKAIYYKAIDDKDIPWNKFIPDAKDSKLDKIKENKNAIQVAVDEYTYAVFGNQRVPEHRKPKLLQQIKQYELDIPQTEAEWLRAFHQISYYIRNGLELEQPEYTKEELALIDSYQMDKDITYGYDTNRYEVCPVCGEMYRKGIEHECCYEEPEKRTKIDILVNGGE